MRAPMNIYGLLPVAALLFVTALAREASAQEGPILGVDPAAGPVSPTIVVSGSVEKADTNDDTPLPSDLRIAVDCHGDRSDGGGTSLSGGFRFTLTPSAMALAAASICSVEAKAFGYDSSVARFPVRSSSGIVNIGTLTIQRNASGNAQEQNKERTGRTVSATSLKAPQNAVKLFDQGSHSLQQGKFAAAAKDFEGAIKIYPEYAESWLGLGSARVSLGTLGTARDAFLRAAELDPQMAGPPAELGLLAARQNDLVSAARYLDESLRLDPGSSYQTCYSDALINLFLKRYDVAERSARAALGFGDNAEHARADYVLGIALLAKGANAEAKQHLVRYLELAPKAPERDQVEKELARVEQLDPGK